MTKTNNNPFNYSGKFVKFFEDTQPWYIGKKNNIDNQNVSKPTSRNNIQKKNLFEKKLFKSLISIFLIIFIILVILRKYNKI
ncbi:Hypothetical protein KVN_LOCUS525 [uncultured virus]|nr:Hypothetical protein KVN_LOCUS525 [uncultured virus]